MKRFFHLALLLGALLGFMGLSAAVAMSPTCAVMMEQSAKTRAANDMPVAAAAKDCCPDVASGRHRSNQSKDMMPNCLAMTGCFVPLALGGETPFAPDLAMKPVAAHWPLATQLSGRSVPPEQRPPPVQS